MQCLEHAHLEALDEHGIAGIPVTMASQHVQKALVHGKTLAQEIAGVLDLDVQPHAAPGALHQGNDFLERGNVEAAIEAGGAKGKALSGAQRPELL